MANAFQSNYPMILKLEKNLNPRTVLKLQKGSAGKHNYEAIGYPFPRVQEQLLSFPGINPAHLKIDRKAAYCQYLVFPCSRYLMATKVIFICTTI